ncbi:NAD(P)-dependent oxidoreductase [Actinomadura physcomitrii]|nr:NAD(P)-dependent oxidoreductase [Actinomadura physcomitrii]
MGAHIVLTQPIHADQLERLRAGGHRVTALESPRGLSAAELADACRTADVLICQLTDQVERRVFETTSLSHVATVSAGHEHVDIAAAAEHGVLVTHTPGVLTDATADLALALILAVTRHLLWGDRAVRRQSGGPWRLLHEPMGLDLSGATLGIVGMGRIGHATALRAHRGFGMKIVYTARRPHAAAEADLGAVRLEPERLLAAADVVSLHAPATAETRHFLNTATLALMKPSAVVINTARGSLIDEPALGRALQRGVIAGAGLDVLENEPAAHPELLAAGDRVVLTPHVGSATARTRRAMAAMAVDDVLAFLAQEAPAHPVPGTGRKPPR